MDSNDSSDGRKPATPPKSRRKSQRAGDGAFDLWLQRGLHQLYDNVASEPVPDELLRLIEEDRVKRDK